MRKFSVNKEDQALLQLYCNRKVTRWTELSRLMKEEFGVRHCNPKKCRERFKNHLNPDIKKEEWQEQEDQKLIELQNKLGNRWAAIARDLPGRTDNSVKNRFYAKMRKAIRNFNAIGKERLERRFKDITISFIFKLSKLIDSHHKQDETVGVELIQKAERLQKDIMAFQNLTSVDTQTMTELTVNIMTGVHEINNSFKKKASRNKNSNISRQERILARIRTENQQVILEGEEVKMEEEKQEVEEPVEQLKAENIPVKQEEDFLDCFKREEKAEGEKYPLGPSEEVQPILVEDFWQEDDKLDFWEDVWVLSEPPLF